KVELVHVVARCLVLGAVDGNSVPHLILHDQHTELFELLAEFADVIADEAVVDIHIINHKYDEDKKKIELRKLSAEADLAEQQALKQKLENIETMRRLQLSSVDAYAEPLATAAKNLAVQPSSATIIDITKILKSQQEDQPPQ
ncbi:MAG: hypothetical protein SOY77_08375, partial [Eubacteriales bacterium]|nr:hypothetical protein [Eubacteriales bacterium]